MKTLAENIKPIMGIMIIGSGIAYFFTCLLIDKEPNGAMIGLVSLAGGYYYGSSTGNAKKDETIQELSKTKN